MHWPLVGAPAVVSVPLVSGRPTAVTAALAPKRPPALGAGAALATAAATQALALDAGRLWLGAGSETGARDAAAIAVAGLASARRDRLAGKATAVGGVLPDGSLAGAPSVADIDRAAAAGITRVGIPAGTRNAYDRGRKKRVDLVSHGAGAGVEVIEVVDLAAAYKLMTGAALPQPRPVTSEEMELGGEVDRRLEAAYQSWRQRLAPEWARVLERGEARLDEAERQLIDRLKQTVAAAEKEHAGGLAASALHRIRSAYARSRELARRASRPLPEPERQVEIEALATAIAEALQAIRADGFGNAGEVIGRAVRARMLARARSLAASALAAGDGYFEREATARMLLSAAADAVEIEGSWGAAAAIRAARAASLARAHRQLAAPLSKAPPAGPELDGKQPGDALIELAAARAAHLRAWVATGRAVLLGIERRPKTGAVLVRDPKSLVRLLELADQSARSGARAAKIAAGEVPVLARVRYQSARVLRGGDVVDQLEALELYWESAWLSQLAVLASR